MWPSPHATRQHVPQARPRAGTCVTQAGTDTLDALQEVSPGLAYRLAQGCSFGPSDQMHLTPWFNQFGSVNQTYCSVLYWHILKNLKSFSNSFKLYFHFFTVKYTPTVQVCSEGQSLSNVLKLNITTHTLIDIYMVLIYYCSYFM